MHPPSSCLRLWCPAVSNYSNHRSSTISCHSQMGIQAAAFIFQRDHVSRGRPGYNSQADDDSPTWSSHLLTRSSVLPGMISEVWPAGCASSGVQTPSVPALSYTFLRQGWFHCNLFVWPCCVSVRNQTRGIHHRRERKQSRSGRAVHPSGWTEQNWGLCAAY